MVDLGHTTFVVVKGMRGSANSWYTGHRKRADPRLDQNQR